MITLQLLGRFGFCVDQQDRSYLLNYDKVKWLLVLLSLERGQAISREKLATLFWPELHRAQGLARLRHALHVLRQALGIYGDSLVSQPRDVALSTQRIQVDLLQVVDQAHLSAELHRCLVGETSLWVGLKIPQSDEFQSWLLPWQRAWQRERLFYRTRHIKSLWENGDLSAALELTQSWLQREVDEEHYHRFVIRSLFLSGQADKAQQAYRYCSEVLRQNKGRVPSVETQALLQEKALRVESILEPSEPLMYRAVATVAFALSWDEQEQSKAEAHWWLKDAEPEDARVYLQSWQDQIVEAASHYGGWVNQHSGSTILVHFGFPRQLENPAAEALLLAQRVGTYKTPKSVKIGIALHVNLVLLSADFQNSFNSLLGQVLTPLVWMAEHNEILLSTQAAARLPQSVIERSVRADKPVYKLATSSSTTAEPALLGRLKEFEYLVEQWHLSRRHNTALGVQVQAPYGMGKSRLAAALGQYASRDGARVIALSTDCLYSPEFAQQLAYFFETQSPMLPIDYRVEDCLVARALALTLQDMQALKKRFYERGAEALGRITEYDLLSVLRLLHVESERPLLVVVDDMDALRTLDLDFVGRVWAWLQQSQAMLLCLSRFEQSLPFDCSVVRLSTLNEEDTQKYIQNSLRGVKCQHQDRVVLQMRSGGRPAYLEAMLHLLRLGLPLTYLPAVADMLLYKLSGLPSEVRTCFYLWALWEKGTTQAFAHMQAMSVTQQKSMQELLLWHGLLSVDARGKVYCDAVMSMAARQVMTKADRQAIYSVLATYLMQHNYDASEVAECLLQAESSEALEWWHKAVGQSLEVGNLLQAADHLANALQSQQYMKDISLRRQFEYEAHLTQGSLEISLQGPASIEAVQAYQRAATLVVEAEELPLIWGRWVLAHGAGELKSSVNLALLLQRQALQSNHSIWFGWGLYAEAQYWFWRGQPELSEQRLNEAILLLDYAPSSADMSRVLTYHSPALAKSLLGLVRVQQGASSLTLLQQAIHLARGTAASPISSMICEIHLLRALYLTNQLPQLLEHSQRLQSLLPAPFQGSIWEAVLQTYSLLSYDSTHKAQLALQKVEQLLPVFEKNMPLGLDAFLCVVARCHLQQTRYELALSYLQRAQEIATERDSGLMLPEIYCLRGDIYCAMQHNDAAQSHWHQSLEQVNRTGLQVYQAWLAMPHRLGAKAM